MTIRRQLVRLVAASVLPALVCNSVLIIYAYDRQRELIEDRTLDVARVLTQTVDRELAGYQAAMLALATTPLGLNGCDRLVDPKLPSDAELFTPPPVYSTWWRMTEACSGLSGSLDAVTWYKTDEVVHDVRTGEVVAGYWTAGSNSIVLTSTVMLDGGTVRHEMLHALLQKSL